MAAPPAKRRIPVSVFTAGGGRALPVETKAAPFHEVSIEKDIATAMDRLRKSAYRVSAPHGGVPAVKSRYILRNMAVNVLLQQSLVLLQGLPETTMTAIYLFDMWLLVTKLPKENLYTSSYRMASLACLVLAVKMQDSIFIRSREIIPVEKRVPGSSSIRSVAVPAQLLPLLNAITSMYNIPDREALGGVSTVHAREALSRIELMILKEVGYEINVSSIHTFTSIFINATQSSDGFCAEKAQRFADILAYAWLSTNPTPWATVLWVALQIVLLVRTYDTENRFPWVSVLKTVAYQASSRKLSASVRQHAFRVSVVKVAASKWPRVIQTMMLKPTKSASQETIARDRLFVSMQGFYNRNDLVGLFAFVQYGFTERSVDQTHPHTSPLRPVLNVDLVPETALFEPPDTPEARQSLRDTATLLAEHSKKTASRA